VRRALLAGLAALPLVGCGLELQSADLFVLTRSGPQGKLTLLVNDGGTIRCDGGRARHLSDAALIQARDVAVGLAPDAQRKLRIAPAAGSVYTYTVRLQQGTLSFADTGTRHHQELAQAELFAVQSAEGVCLGRS
jgi:hypothetical protein